MPVEPLSAPTRRTAIQVWLLVCAVAVASTEALTGALTRGAVLVVWGAVLLVGAAAWWRAGRFLGRVEAWGRARAWARARARTLRSWPRLEQVGLAVLCGLLLAELLVAILAEPNNFDSQTYHLARIEHWVVDRSVSFYPTAIHRQITLPPGVEYLLLQLRLITGGDALYNLVQYAAGLVCLIATTRITAQLGGGRRAQLITALLVGTTPMVVLQSTSTQTDLVVASWAACLATLALDGVRRPATLEAVLSIGAATGLLAVAKTTGLLVVGPLLVIWSVGQLHQHGVGHRVGRTAIAGLGIVLVAFALAGPYLIRMTTEFGSPLGPPQLSDSIPTQRHDPAAIVLNGLRIGLTALDTPIPFVRDAGSTVTGAISHLLGIPINDPALTFAGTKFPVVAWYPDEDRVSFPISGSLAAIAVLLALLRPRRTWTDRPGLIRAYALVPTIGFVLYATSVKWQPWGNRLLLFLLVLALPVAGVWLGSITRQQSHRPVARRVVAGLLAVSCLGGLLAVGYGFPRSLVGPGSVFTTDANQTRFLRRPQWLPGYAWAAGVIQSSGARHVGLIEANNDFEYPWWVFLPGRDFVSLRSVLPQHPPAAPTSVQAIVCTAPESVCTRLIPAGWTYQRRGTVAVALPPRAHP